MAERATKEGRGLSLRDFMERHGISYFVLYKRLRKDGEKLIKEGIIAKEKGRYRILDEEKFLAFLGKRKKKNILVKQIVYPLFFNFFPLAGYKSFGLNGRHYAFSGYDIRMENTLTLKDFRTFLYLLHLGVKEGKKLIIPLLELTTALAMGKRDGFLAKQVLENLSRAELYAKIPEERTIYFFGEKKKGGVEGKFKLFEEVEFFKTKPVYVKIVFSDFVVNTFGGKRVTVNYFDEVIRENRIVFALTYLLFAKIKAHKGNYLFNYYFGYPIEEVSKVLREKSFKVKEAVGAKRYKVLSALRVMVNKGLIKSFRYELAPYEVGRDLVLWFKHIEVAK